MDAKNTTKQLIARIGLICLFPQGNFVIMKQKILGSTGLRVSELSLGTMTFGEDFGWGSSIDESRQVFNTFLDKGGNFIDTADFYTNGSSEKLIGEFSQGIRDRLVI